MRHGNIYPPSQAEQALGNFFRIGNLAALRQLALQRVAHEVENQLSEYMHEHGLQGWESGERVLVLLDNTHASEVAVRRAWRLANAFNAELIAAHPVSLMTEQGMTHILTVAMDLNATLAQIEGVNVAKELHGLVREYHVGHVVVIAAPQPWYVRWRSLSLAERLLTAEPHLDVHLVSRIGGS